MTAVVSYLPQGRLRKLEKSIGRDWLNSRESFFIRIAKQVIREILSSKYERTWLHHRLYRTGRFYSDQNRTTSKVNVTPLIITTDNSSCLIDSSASVQINPKEYLLVPTVVPDVAGAFIYKEYRLL